MINMANTRIKRVTAETRSQGARILLKEALRVEMCIRLMHECEKVELRNVVKVASVYLPDYIFEKFSSGFKDWDKILGELRKDEEMEVERNERIGMVEGVYKTVMTERREKQKEEKYRLYKIRKNTRVNAKCSICQRVGHRARECWNKTK
ncbi:hypothetical protein NGRA_2852 [Nosema granulosis]|uniref:CCHC-type domain-containing protein n=1 Tax=Nosema granulosis TaxID=83296 RepID=A0A9P6GWB6_9MICR|nr:hypothetical protein NGRA_2852 [Nosema granulosis]